MKVKIEGMEDYKPTGARKKAEDKPSVEWKPDRPDKPDRPGRRIRPDRPLKQERQVRDERRSRMEKADEGEAPEASERHRRFGQSRKERAQPEVIAEWELDPDEVIKVEPKKKVKGKRAVVLGLLVIGIIILAGSGLYYYVIPRMDVELITVYHEGTGGGSSGGFISVNTQISNKGTREITDVNITLEVIDVENGMPVASYSDSFYSISRGEDWEPHLNFMGDHYQAYDVFLKLEFESNGESYSKEYIYKTGDSEAMNQIFKENIAGW